ncbi:MAG: MtnX-like HAD-IB family phosphatase [Melioribacteraceae bacterium]|nr:MtnX-like HAD-IB family phosphatase [Melioribacteraceae bacterium]MCF8264961.1 MtnX-like HAD-IB family phosphatase [Melioribacteraceae bacterium]MCF8411775.1 MtnX-like HAD-IB family phosphatase [Melioribacteraceae bacterium]MCF8432288.1 MtnX-like HAD-IB family phosphatase [Melioribacteraceae bacterium]
MFPDKVTDINFKIFIDFDGTITKTDVGEAMFLEYGDPQKAQEIIKEWIDNKITSVQTWQQLCETIESLDLNLFDNFISNIEIDKSFIPFVNYCRNANIELKILSDGLDYYISRILKQNGLSEIQFFSNSVSFGENNKPVPSFPHTDEECPKCANCKRNHIINGSSDEDVTIYIGDGFSDTCPAQYCDFIFAKHSLLKYCEQNRISYYPYNTFDDVLKVLIELSKKKRIKKRHQASLKRRDVYLQG